MKTHPNFQSVNPQFQDATAIYNHVQKWGWSSLNSLPDKNMIPRRIDDKELCENFEMDFEKIDRFYHIDDDAKTLIVRTQDDTFGTIFVQMYKEITWLSRGDYPMIFMDLALCSLKPENVDTEAIYNSLRRDYYFSEIMKKLQFEGA